MRELLTGECLCGQIKFSGESEIKRIVNCHCTDCQKITGAAFATIIFVNEQKIKIDGDPKVFEHISDKGSKLKKYFCLNCGSQMFSKNSERPGLIGLRAGSLDQKNLVKPEVNVYISSMIKSTPINKNLTSFKNMPN